MCPLLLLILYQDRMQANVPFEASEDGFYRIASALDRSKCFTIHQSGALVIDSYRGAPNQKFNIYANNNKFAFVSQQGAAVFVAQDSTQDGAKLTSDPGQHKSSFFDMLHVTSGPFAGNGFYIKTFCSKSIDVNEGNTAAGTAVIQWAYHGRENQIWLVSPASQQQQQQQQPKPYTQITSKNTFQEVPAAFTPTNTTYKILSALNTSKALTVGNDHGLRISDYTGDASQRYMIMQDGAKFAFVVGSFQEGLCVFKDAQENGGKIVSDSGKHPSSWFEIVRASAGEWQNKGYKIKTFAHRALDVTEGKTDNGTAVVQWSEHNDFNQVWLILPADQAVPKYESKSGSGSGSGNNLFGINLPNIPGFSFPQLPGGLKLPL